ncbi:hypothetical protein [Streptosporangium sp. NPDC000396]
MTEWCRPYRLALPDDDFERVRLRPAIERYFTGRDEGPANGFTPGRSR